MDEWMDEILTLTVHMPLKDKINGNFRSVQSHKMSSDFIFCYIFKLSYY